MAVSKKPDHSRLCCSAGGSGPCFFCSAVRLDLGESPDLQANATAAPASAQRSGDRPYGGTLVDLMVPLRRAQAVKASATKTLECSDRNACDVELLVVGGFCRCGFMHQEEYDVVSGHRLAGQLFGLPIVMDTDRDDVVVGDSVLFTYKGQTWRCFRWKRSGARQSGRSQGLLRHHLD